MLPLSVLNAAVGHSMLVELKNGETYNGRLVNCDNRMNLNLTQVICTSKDGDKFWQMADCYIRGNNIKYLRVPPELIDAVKEEVLPQKNSRGRGRGLGRGRGRAGGQGRGGRGGRGGGRGRGA